MGLRTASLNCNGLKSAMVDIQRLCEDHDVLFLQETWLYKDETHELGTIHHDFNGYGVSAITEDKDILKGRPYGGSV